MVAGVNSNTISRRVSGLGNLEKSCQARQKIFSFGSEILFYLSFVRERQNFEQKYDPSSKKKKRASIKKRSCRKFWLNESSEFLHWRFPSFESSVSILSSLKITKAPWSLVAMRGARNLTQNYPTYLARLPWREFCKREQSSTQGLFHLGWE